MAKKKRLKRFFRINSFETWIITVDVAATIFLGIIGYSLNKTQNQLTVGQNDLMKAQLDLQSNQEIKLEAERVNSRIFKFDGLMDAINNDLEDELDTLNELTVSRIHSVLRVLSDGDSIIQLEALKDKQILFDLLFERHGLKPHNEAKILDGGDFRGIEIASMTFDKLKNPPSLLKELEFNFRQREVDFFRKEIKQHYNRPISQADSPYWDELYFLQLIGPYGISFTEKEYQRLLKKHQLEVVRIILGKSAVTDLTLNESTIHFLPGHDEYSFDHQTMRRLICYDSDITFGQRIDAETTRLSQPYSINSTLRFTGFSSIEGAFIKGSAEGLENFVLRRQFESGLIADITADTHCEISNSILKSNLTFIIGNKLVVSKSYLNGNIWHFSPYNHHTTFREVSFIDCWINDEFIIHKPTEQLAQRLDTLSDFHNKFRDVPLTFFTYDFSNCIVSERALNSLSKSLKRQVKGIKVNSTHLDSLNWHHSLNYIVKDGELLDDMYYIDKLNFDIGDIYDDKDVEQLKATFTK